MDARPLAIVLVAAVDRRMLPAVALLPQLVGVDAMALHVATDPEQSYRLARDWMDIGITSLPLQVIEPTADTIAATVRTFIEHERVRRPRVTVIVPEMDLGRWWQPLLHRGVGRAVAWELADLRGVTTVVVPVRTATMTG